MFGTESGLPSTIQRPEAEQLFLANQNKATTNLNSTQILSIRKRGKTCTLSLHVIGLESGKIFFSQSQCATMQNQNFGGITN